MERSEHRIGTLRVGVAAVLAALIAGCGFPDFTYDLPEDASAGAAGSAGTEAGDVSAEQTGQGGSGGSQPEAGDDVAEAAPHDGAEDAAEVSPDAQDTGAESGEDAPLDVTDVDEGTDAADDSPAADAQDAALEATPDADAQDAVAEEAAPPPDTGAEDCTNGQDDDNDGKVDCQDSDCTVLYKCVAPPPTGWTGLFQLYEGPSVGVPGCSMPFSTLAIAAGRDPVQTPASCTACKCGSPNGVGCDDAKLVIWENATCDSQTGWSNFTFTPYGACKGWNLNASDGGVATPAAASWVAMPAHQPGTGFCSPSGGVANLATPDWNMVGAACEVDQTGAGCPGQNVCAPRPVSGFKTGLCIYTTGAVNCPTGAYSNKFTFYQSYTDTRDCNGCACDSPTGVTCNATMTIATNSTCAGAAVEATFSDLSCHAIDPLTLQYLQYTQEAPTGGTCAPTGGEPIGTVANDPATAYTFCCMPF